MAIPDTMIKAIDKQINAEFYSSYLYLSMASYCESAHFAGCANWMKAQAREEDEHAMRFYAYLFEQGAKVTLAAIDAPPTTWKSPLDVFKQVYAHEMKVTGLIHDLLKLAKAQNDPTTENALQWFVKEQVEEEANAKAIVDKLEMIGDDAGGLATLDKKLGERT